MNWRRALIRLCRVVSVLILAFAIMVAVRAVFFSSVATIYSSYSYSKPVKWSVEENPEQTGMLREEKVILHVDGLGPTTMSANFAAAPEAEKAEIANALSAILWKSKRDKALVKILAFG